MSKEAGIAYMFRITTVPPFHTNTFKLHRNSPSMRMLHIQYLATRVNVDVEKALKQEHDRCQLAQHISRKQVRRNP